MRLLNTDNFKVEEFRDDGVPRYAILSHTWGEEEVTFQDMEQTRVANKKGYEKVQGCSSVARANGFKYVWIDTCCTIQSHHRRQCPMKRAVSAAENDGSRHQALMPNLVIFSILWE